MKNVRIINFQTILMAFTCICVSLATSEVFAIRSLMFIKC